MGVKRGFLLGLAIGGVTSLFVGGTLFVWTAGSSFSWGFPVPGRELSVFLALAALLLIPVGGFLLIPKKTRGIGIMVATSSIIFVVCYVWALNAGDAVRMRGFEHFTSNVAPPVIRAIEQYSVDHGQPPGQLSDLVPQYLSRVSDTGVGSAPHFRYIAQLTPQWQYHSNPWVLILDVPTGAINWDILIYYPLQNYPSEGHGGYLEPVGDWAYVHE